jgi:uncharacterized phage-associated protein
MYNIFEIADWFLTKESMSPKKLQKLCYYAQGWNLALKHRKLIDCTFEAWVHGPVCFELYDKYKNYGWNHIPQNIEKSIIAEDELDILGSVWCTYGEYDGQQLEILTHREIPWINARKGLDIWDNSNNVIAEKDMEGYYRLQYMGD